MLTPNTRLDRQLSVAAATAVDAQIKQCYRNSVMALLVAPELADCEYVEGTVLVDDLPIPIEHGWLETPTGWVVDPTLVVSHRAEKGPKRALYFAGAKYSARTVRKWAFTHSLPFCFAAPDTARQVRESFVAALLAIQGGTISKEVAATYRRMFRLDDRTE